MPKTDVPIDPDAACIRTAAGHRLCHLAYDDGLIRFEIAIVTNPTNYASHRVILSNADCTNRVLCNPERGSLSRPDSTRA
jgi:hypothetical protein